MFTKLPDAVGGEQNASSIALREGELGRGTINLKGALLDAARGRAPHATSICIRRSFNNQIPVVLTIENLTACKAKELSQEAVLTLIDNVLNTACHNCTVDLEDIIML
jgi:hypothetical protein